MEISWQPSLLSLPALFAAILSFTIAVLIWRRKDLSGTAALFWLMLAITIWSLSEALEKSAQGIPLKIFISKIQYVGIASTPTLFFIFTLRYCQFDNWLTRWRLALLWLVPLVTIGLVATNDYHNLHWSGYTLDPETNLITFSYGPWFRIWVTISYIQLFIAVAILFRSALVTQNINNRQIWMVILAALVPWISNVFYLLGFSPARGLDLTPLAFTITGALLAISIFRFRLVDITPIARDKIVATIPDAVVAFDNVGKIIDLNPAACKLIGIQLQDAIGNPASQVLSKWPYLESILNFPGKLKDSTIKKVFQDDGQRWYNLTPWRLYGSQNNLIGWVFLLRDITEQRKAEREISRLATVIEQANTTIVITDLDGNIEYANPHFELTTGYAVEDAIGKNPNILNSGIQDISFYKKMWDTIKSGESWEGNFVNKRKDGSMYQEAAAIFPVKVNGQIINFAAVKRDITQQVEAEDALRSFSEKLSALHEISMELALTTTLDQLSVLAIERACERLGFDRIEIWFTDPRDPDYLTELYCVDENDCTRDVRDLRVKIKPGSLHEQILSSSTRIFYADNQDILDYQGKVIGSGDVAASTLWDGRKNIGYIRIDNSICKEPITNYQKELLLLLAQIVGNLASRKRIETAIQKSEIRHRMLNELTRVAISQTDFMEMLQILADSMGELLDADGCYITLWDESTGQVTPGAAAGSLKEIYPQILPPDPGEPTFTKAVLSTGKPLPISNIHKTSYLNSQDAVKFPAKSQLALPLIANQRKLGAVLIAYNQRHKFKDEEIQIGEQAASQIALAILKAKLLDETELRLKEAETLRQAGIAMAASLRQDEAIESILEELNRVVPYDSASVQLRHGNEMVIVGVRGFTDNQAILGLKFSLDENSPDSIVFERKKPLILEDAPALYSTFKEVPHAGIRGWMGVPIILQDRIIGMLALDSHQPGSFTPDHARLATAFAAHVALTLENARLFEETQRLATHDYLTGLFNRRHFMELARQAFRRAKRYNEPLSVIMLDIDHFKNVNDVFGHLVGDQVLQKIARICQKQLRQADIIGRFGGEEFVILLPQTSAQKTDDYSSQYPAINVAERLRESVKNTTIETERGDIQTTISLGVAERLSTSANVEQIIDQADLALLDSKSRGRNKTTIANEK